MRLWVLVLCVALLVVCFVTAFSYIGERVIPTADNDHLLDGVSGLRGPKK